MLGSVYASAGKLWGWFLLLGTRVTFQGMIGQCLDSQSKLVRPEPGCCRRVAITCNSCYRLNQDGVVFAALPTSNTFLQANRATYVPYFYSRDGYAVLGHSNVTHFNMMAVRPCRVCPFHVTQMLQTETKHEQNLVHNR